MRKAIIEDTVGVGKNYYPYVVTFYYNNRLDFDHHGAVVVCKTLRSAKAYVREYMKLDR